MFEVFNYMTKDKKFTNINDIMAYLFGFDHIEINRTSQDTIKMKAIISSGETVINFYKIFQSYIDEIKNAENDQEALILFKKHLAEHKNAFDSYMKVLCKDIINAPKNFEVDFTLSFEGEFKTVYDKISELVI